MVVTYSVLGAVVADLVGDAATVTVLMPNGIDPHDYEPSAKDIAAMEDDLRNGRVRVFFYNRQVVDPLTEQLLAAAAAGKVPVVGVTETRPDGMTYAEWMLGTLDETGKALATPSS